MGIFDIFKRNYSNSDKMVRISFIIVHDINEEEKYKNYQPNYVYEDTGLHIHNKSNRFIRSTIKTLKNSTKEEKQKIDHSDKFWVLGIRMITNILTDIGNSPRELSKIEKDLMEESLSHIVDKVITNYCDNDSVHIYFDNAGKTRVECFRTKPNVDLISEDFGTIYI